MRLLNTTELDFGEFFDSTIPAYAILSHRWEKEEITYKDVLKRRNLESKGWGKVRKCCAFVRQRGYEWVWIDTCCIDKKSSAELSESINSMFKWYRGSEVCYAYLGDVSCCRSDLITDACIFLMEQDIFEKGRFYKSANHCSQDLETQIRGSKWFVRGWTLQELIAPERVLFVDRDWEGVIGSKSTLRNLISNITGIEEVARFDLLESTPISIATKMSWASKRECSRQEDLAYCLMGLFNINMPLLYGEGGQNAFIRLQTPAQNFKRF